MRKKSRVSWATVLVAAIFIAGALRTLCATRVGASAVPQEQHARLRRRNILFVAYLVLAALAALLAVATYSSSDIPASVFVLAVLWFVFPLARAHRRGDHALTQALIEERSEPFTILFVKWLSWVVIGFGALAASLYIVPAAALLVVLLSPIESASRDTASLVLACGVFGGTTLAAVLYPFSAGLCEGMDCIDARSGGRVLRLLAGIARWGGRRITTPVADLLRVLRAPCAEWSGSAGSLPGS